MPRNTNPWFKFFFRDWMESERVRNMSCAAQGLYIRALCVQSVYGSIPCEKDDLALALQVRNSEMNAWDETLSHFNTEETEQGKRLFNSRLREILNEKQNISEARSKSGTKGKQKGNKRSASGSTRARARSDSKSNSKSSFLEDSFNRLWLVYPNRKSRATAYTAWGNLNPDPVLAEKIVEHVRVRAEKDPDWLKDGGQYIPMCSTFLNQRRFEDEYKTGRVVSRPHSSRPEPDTLFYADDNGWKDAGQ